MHYRWFDEDEPRRQRGGREERPIEDAAAPAAKKKRLSGRMEIFGCVMAVGTFLYGFTVWDIPLLYLSAGFLLYVASPYVRLLGGPMGTSLSNLLRGFSVALFVGALFMSFF